MSDGARSRAERRRDTEHRLVHDIDLWVASASSDGTPYLTPLSFDWDGASLLLSTSSDTPTGRNLIRTRAARLALGGTRDVTIIEGDVEVLRIDDLPANAGDRFAARAGFDPRELRDRDRYHWFRVTPRRILVWREENELADRELMNDGHWLA